MNPPAHTKKNGLAAEPQEGRISMEDIRAHLARFGRDIPNVLPLVSTADEAVAKTEPEPRKEEPKTKEGGLGPLDTRGLQQALIHRPWDVNSPY